MWYSCYKLKDWTFWWYWVPCFCTHPGCNKEIDRGVWSVCWWDPFSDEFWCALRFCESHLDYMPRRWWGVNVCKRCKKLQKPFIKKPESKERIEHISTDESREEWRINNKESLEERKKEAI